ncbi:NADPH:ferredoxin-NADP+ reductase [Cryptosporidium canis]|uniref:NADPH:ferredoxin-NADP+ reductase n=1 Tax=Cryptosporidium canis TaxID=195482 RepID=A0ABQ8PAY4_9CRYT|nr:NADPH:ferredoxin-NADP+ reductase [Cryptosporidium canis]
MKIRNYKPVYHLCIVGAGPSGCYLAKSLLNQSRKERFTIKIDLLDSLDRPFGLLRYGIAPDRNELKRSIYNIENSLFKKYPEKVKFYGNITLGYDIKIEELKRKYDVVVLAIGGSQSFHTLPVKYMSSHLLNTVIGGVFPSRDWVFYYNNHPLFKNILNSPKKEDSISHKTPINNMGIELKYTKKNQFFEHKSPISCYEDSTPYDAGNEEFKYGYTSDILKTQITNSSERNAVIIGNGNVSLDITRMLSFYSYNQLSKNKYLNSNFLNLIYTSSKDLNQKIEQPLFKNIYIIGRRGWVQNSFKYPLLKEFIDKSRKSKRNSENGTSVRVIMPREDFELSQDQFELDESEANSKVRFLKMKSIFQEMVDNHEEYMNNLHPGDKTINIHFRNLLTPINIKTEQVNIQEHHGSNESIPFIKGIEFARSNYSYTHSKNITLNEKERYYFPCQLLITSLGFQPKYNYIFGGIDQFSVENNSNACPVYKTGWMNTNSKGDLNYVIQNSHILSHEILDFLRKATPKNVCT